MKKATIFLLFVFISGLLSAQWVVDDGFGFKINVPSDWTRETKTEGTDKIYDFVHPSNNIFLEVRAFKADASVTADAIAQYFESQYLPSANRIAFENYTLNNTPGKFAGYTMTVNGLDVAIGSFYAVKNGFGYVLWTMIETRLYNQYSGIGDDVLNTFTTFSASNTARRAVVPPSFKITNMKLGKSLTSNYDILAQDETKEFLSSQEKIYVIWDWEGKAVGKVMTVKWYYNGQEIRDASKSYTLPADNQGYGYANIIKPSGGFKAGRYYVQIDFQGQKQRRIDFDVKKPASNAGADFVIIPPGKKSNSSNKENGGGKTLKPGGSGNKSSSNFKLDYQSFKLGEELQAGSKSNLKTSSKKFYKNTPQVISVYEWDGNGSGHRLKVNWHYYAPGSSDKISIVSSTYDFPNQNGGASNFSLSRPDAGWPEGQYWVEYYLDGKFENEFRFDVVPGSSSAANATNSAWGNASGGSSSNQSSGNSSSAAKKIVLTSAGSQSCYDFKTGKIHGDHQNADIMVEPWCTEDVGVCGNWVLTNHSNMDAITSAPANGYLSDGKSFTDCDVMAKNKVVIVKLKDGTYAKMMILKTDFTKSNSQNPPCQHKASILVEYPAF